MQKEVARIHELTASGQGFKPLVDVMEEISQQTRGWKSYFSFGYPSKVSNRINQAIQDRLEQHARRRRQRRFKKPEDESYYASFKRLGVALL